MGSYHVGVTVARERAGMLFFRLLQLPPFLGEGKALEAHRVTLKQSYGQVFSSVLSRPKTTTSRSSTVFTPVA